MQRKLAAILSADVVGYSGLMAKDEAGTLERLKTNRARVFDPQVAIHGGRVFKLIGDGALAEFPSVIAAVECALAIQAATEKAATGIRYRVGVNLGEVIAEGDDIYGDGVNVAARLQTLAPIGGVALSRIVKDQIEGKIACGFHDMGEHAVKDHDRPVHAFSAMPAGDMRGGGDAAVPAARELSICVLPFANMSGDLEQEYFSDGISEDIITDLSKVSALSVVSRNTAFTYKGKNVKVRQVAGELCVSHVLEGSVRKAGGRVRITAQLIDGSNDAHVWAERYDRDLSDIFALQDEISEAIVKALKLKLLPEEKKAIERRGTENIEAYNIYLMARQQYAAGILTDVRKNDTVIRLCRAALELDPNYARAWALLATAQRSRIYVTGEGDNGVDAATRALALDDGLAEAHAALAGAQAARGRYEDARQEIDIALRLDAGSVDVNREAARLAFHQGRLSDAVRHWEFVSTQSVTDYASGCLLITALQALGDMEELRRVARRTLERAEFAVKQEPDSGAAMGALVTTLAVLGEADRARAWAKRAILVDPENYTMRYNLACDFTLNLRDAEMALQLLTPVTLRMGPERLAWLKVDPDFDLLRDNPKFQELLAAAEVRLATEKS